MRSLIGLGLMFFAAILAGVSGGLSHKGTSGTVLASLLPLLLIIGWSRPVRPPVAAPPLPEQRRLLAGGQRGVREVLPFLLAVLGSVTALSTFIYELGGAIVS